MNEFDYVDDAILQENIDITKQKLALKQDKMQFTTMPPASTYNGKVVVYIGETDSNYTKGQSYLSNGVTWTETASKVEPATSSTAGIVKPDNTSITVDSNGTISTPALLQMTVLPTASADYLGKIVQLTQAQTGYTKGFIYECVSDGNDPPAYSWTETNVQGSIDISAQTGNQIETKADGIYVGETTVIEDVDTLPTGNDIEDVFYRVTSTGKLYKGDSTNQTTSLVAPDLAVDFDETINYAIGQYVVYNGDLYKCTTAHTAGVWDTGHFTEVTIGDELTLKQNKTLDTPLVVNGTTVTTVEGLMSLFNKTYIYGTRYLTPTYTTGQYLYFYNIHEGDYIIQTPDASVFLVSINIGTTSSTNSWRYCRVVLLSEATATDNGTNRVSTWFFQYRNGSISLACSRPVTYTGNHGCYVTQLSGTPSTNMFTSYMNDAPSGSVDVVRISDYQKKSLDTALTINGVTVTTVENALDALNDTFTGTTAEWEALTADEKAKYTVVNFTDDESPEEFDARLSAVEDVIPSGASASNQLVTAADIDAIEAALENYARTDVISITTEAELTAFRTSKDITQPFYNAQQVAINSNGLYLPPYFRGVLVSNSSALILWGAVGNDKYMYYYGSNGWQGGKILISSDLTSTVTSNSTAPITSGALATVSDTTISDQSSAISNFGITYKRSGVVVDIQCSYLKVDSSISAWSALATLTNLLKPTVCDSYFSLFNYNTGASAGMLFIAKNSNQIKCGTTIPAGAYYFSCCYVA